MFVTILKKFQGHCFVHFAALSGRDRRLLSVINSMPVLIRRGDGLRVELRVIGVHAVMLFAEDLQQGGHTFQQHKPLLCLDYILVQEIKHDCTTQNNVHWRDSSVICVHDGPKK